MQSSLPGFSSIASNFNGTAVPDGDFIWFSSVFKAGSLGSSTVRIFLRAASIQFSAGGTSYNIPVPDALITFSPGATAASTIYDPNKNEWITTVPTGLSGNTFLSGVTFPVPATGLPGGINPVTWSGTFYSDTNGVSINWQWAAAVYSSFGSDYRTLGVKPVDDPSVSQYKNSDHAGTPENYKSFVTGGARGGGGSNYTGSYSATAWIAPIIAVPNYPPVANAGPDQTTHVTDTVQLDGTGSTDRDGDPLTYRWSFASVPAGSTVALNNPNSAKPAFTVDEPGSYAVELIVNDGKVDSDPDTVTITTINSPPVANAGPNQTVHVTDTVTLDGSASSDVDGDPLTYAWTLTSVPAGSLAQLSSSSTVKPTFVVDTKGTYTAQLIVNDGKVNSTPATVTITTENSPPVANPGPAQTVQAGHTVQLDGSGSNDVDGDLLTFRWSILSAPAGSVATLSDPSAVKPSFLADELGTYVVQLIVNDGTVDGVPATVTITTVNSPPVANAGANQTVFVGSTVTLDGSGSSDVDGDPLTYRWSITAPQTSTAQLLNPASVNPTFVLDVKGTYVAQLIVNDGFVDSNPATVTISTQNSPPVANAGPAQTIMAGNTVHLNGSGSTDVDGDPLTFRWAFTNKPAASLSVLSDPSAVAPSFFADQVGTYVLQLIVNDGTVDSAPSTVTITTQDSPPVANAGLAQSVAVGALVILDGSASSDPDGQALTYQWSLLSVPAGSTAVLADAISTNPTFSADLPGSYVVQLIVNDGFVNSAASTVTISTINSVPVANAGPAQTVLPGTIVQLDGSGSSDADHDPLTYKWALTVFPTGSTAALSNTTLVNPTFVPNVAGTYVAQLIVNDGKVDSPPATVMITAGSPVVQLTPPAATTGLPGQTLSLTFLATNTGIFDALQTMFSSGTTTVPLGVIAVGQTQSAVAGFTVQAIAPKGAAETDASYLSRLQAADNQSSAVTGNLTWSDVAGNVYGPVSAATSVTEQIPVITIALSAPAIAQAASPITYTLTLTNVGHATGTVSGISVTLPDGSVQSPVLSQTTLAPGASATATAQFSIPVSQTGTISAVAQVTWQDGNANSYGPVSATAVTEVNGIAPAVLASCVPSGSISVLQKNGTVTSYVPNGSWIGGTTGIRLAQIEGPGADPVSLSTPKVVNSCSSNSVTGQTVCTSNGTDVYLLKDSSITNTLTSGSTGTARFSGGSCQTCGVTINAATNQAVLTVGLAGSSPSGIANSGIQFLDLSTNMLSPPVPTTSGITISEDISVDPVRNFVLSPSEQSTYELFQFGASGTTVFDQHFGVTNFAQYELDSSAEDCTTGIALASVEQVLNTFGQPTGTGGVFISDLTQAVLAPGTTNTWTLAEFQQINELAGMDGIAVAPGSQLGVAAEEFGDDRVGVFRLPATSGSGVPAVQDWAQGTIPNPGEPNGATRFLTGGDPHTITAYTSPNDGRAYGVVSDGGPFFLAIVDLAALLNQPRITGSHVVDRSIDLVANGVIRFVPLSTFLKFPASPNSAPQGTQNLAVEIRGAATHFSQGVTTVSFGAGISIASVTVNSPTDLTAIVNIDPTTTVGPRVVSVTTGTEVLSTANATTSVSGAFAVTQGPATISAISPPSAVQGQTVMVTITGSATHFAQGVTTVNFGFSTAASTVTAITVNSPTTITATLNISPLELASLRNVQITTGGEIARGTFTVTRGPATLTNVSPNSGSLGRQHLTITLTGQATHFAQGVTTVSSDFFNSVSSVTVSSPTSLTAVVNISSGTTLGLHSITATTSGEVATLSNGFNVTPGVPTLFSLSPASSSQGSQTVTVGVSGQFTHFTQGVSVADFGPGVTVSSFTVTSTTTGNAVISIDPLAALGTRNISVTTGSEAAAMINGFTINTDGAIISSFSPTSMAQGQQNATVTINGFQSHFTQAISTAAFGPGITVNSLTVNSPTSATAVVSVDPTATGPRTIAVATKGETAVSTGSLNITTGIPELTRLAPSSAQPGTQNLSVTITGLSTHFVQGTSVANFGAGVTLAAFSVNSATSATAVVNVDPAAALGARNVTVTTGTEVAGFNHGFLVVPPPPGVSLALTEGQEITKPTAIVGTVSAGNWVLSYALASQDGTGPAPAFVPFASGTTAVSNGVLGTFDPSLLLNGNYIIQLTSTDQFGQISTIIANVEVERNVKVGNFTLSFNDLNVPMPGLPITVTRTYDTAGTSRATTLAWAGRSHWSTCACRRTDSWERAGR